MSLYFSDFTRTSLLFIFLSLFLLTACEDGDKGASKRKKTAHLVETVKASYQNISIKRTITGTLQPVREVRIINQTEGLLTDLPVFPGDIVKQGQTLAQLDDARLKAELQKARASLEQAKLDLHRLQELAPKKMASESEIAQAKTQLDIATAELQLKQTEFTHTRITAPMDGTISERLVEPGDVIPLYTHILSIIDTSTLKAEINLSELLLPAIKTGNSVNISIDALGKQTFSGSIARIYPSIDKNTRKGIIEITLNPVPAGALPGQLCRVTIATASTARLMIPYDAVRHDKKGSFVYAVINNQAIRVNISLGIQQGELVEVVNGLEDQQTIISKGFFGLKEKMDVKTASPDIKAAAR